MDIYYRNLNFRLGVIVSIDNRYRLNLNKKPPNDCKVVQHEKTCLLTETYT